MRTPGRTIGIRLLEVGLIIGGFAAGGIHGLLFPVGIALAVGVWAVTGVGPAVADG